MRLIFLIVHPVHFFSVPTTHRLPQMTNVQTWSKLWNDDGPHNNARKVAQVRVRLLAPCFNFGIAYRTRRFT